MKSPGYNTQRVKLRSRDWDFTVNLRLGDWAWAFISAIVLLAAASFVLFVIRPGGFEGQIGWAFALMPGMPVGLILADRVYKITPSADRIVLWSSALGITLLWYFAVSYAVIKTCRLFVRVIR